MSEQEPKNKYGEPWIQIHSESYIISTSEGWIRLVETEGGYGSENGRNFNARIVKLINLFAGVPDSILDQITDSVYVRNPIMDLIRSILTCNFDSVPLAMLIDEIQNSDEYVNQTRCYKTWQQLYDKLIDIADTIERMMKTDRAFANQSSLRMRLTATLSEEIRNFLKPMQEYARSHTMQPREGST